MHKNNKNSFEDENKIIFHNFIFLKRFSVGKLFQTQKCAIESKAFNFINLAKVLRQKEVCDNLQSKSNISDTLVVVYNINSSFKSTLFNY